MDASTTDTPTTEPTVANPSSTGAHNHSSSVTLSPKPMVLSDLDKIKAAQASRRSRRSRPPIQPPSTRVEQPNKSKSTDVSTSDDDTEAEKLRNQISTLELEMASLRRNHLTNLKEVQVARDMFASQLAREQSLSSKPSLDDAKKASDMAAQLRAARTRNNDLESENNALRDDVKQLNFRVQAGKTLAAANDGYDLIVDELVSMKLKNAQLQEEKEDLLKINRELTHTNAVLSDANGELEKSRSTWVVQCAELETQRAALEKKVKDMVEAGNPDTSYTGSDLQNIQLN